MSGIYIFSDYGKLQKEDDHLIYKNSEGLTRKIFADKAEILVLSGHTTITADSFMLLAKNQIPVFFMEKGDVPNISLDFGLSKNGFLRQKQYRLLDDEKQSLETAKMIVCGKIKNQITFLNRIKRNKCEDLLVQCNKMNEVVKNVLHCKNIDKLRGLEGIAAKYYFDLFDYNLTPDWAVFGKRSKNPPQTNVNAVLSYLYTMLTYRVQVALESVGLDTMCSNLHVMTYGKESLAYDMVEEFRTPIADCLCCSLFNLEKLKPNDFEEKNDGIYLTSEACKKVITAFEEKLESTIFYTPTAEELSYFEIIFEQAKAYKRYILGENKIYTPFVMR